MSIASWRNYARLFSKYAGDVQAVRKGRIGARIQNRIVGKVVTRALWKTKLFRR